MSKKWILILSLLLTMGLVFAQVNITPIRTDVDGFPTWTDTNIAGTTYLQMLVANANTVSPAMNFNNYTSETLNFKARTYGGTNTVENVITVSISIDNGSTWTILGTRTPTTNTLTAMTAFDLSSYSGTQVKVKFSVAGTINTIGAGIDDISITGIAGGVSANISVTPTTLTGFTYVSGSGPSTTQTFTVSGSNLTSNITIIASTNYQISLSSGSGYTTPITLNHNSGSVASTTIYVRLKAGLAVGTYNSETISVSSTGATSGSVTCSGSVTDTEPSGGYIVNFDGATEIKTSYASGTVNLSGLNWDMTEALIGNLSNDFFNGVKSARLSGKATSSITMLEDKTGGLGTFSFKYRRYASEAQVPWIAEYSTNSGSTWIQAGSAFTATEEVQTFSQVINVSGNVRVRIKLATDTGTTNKRMNIDDISLSDYSGGTPVASITVNPSSLIGFSYVAGNGPSAVQSFTIGGAYLSNNISISATTNYEISLSSGSGYTTPITLTHSSGTVASTTIYVRLKAGLASGEYNSELIVASSGTATTNVSCSGSVTASSAPAAPVATDGTLVTDSSFNANWSAVSGATNYYLDAYTRGASELSELFISEYIEGSSYNKAIEVYNGTGSTVDLTQYSLRKQVNGAGEFVNNTPLIGTLANGEVFVVAHSSANAAILAQADLTLASSPLDFNGNDAVALYKNDVQIDVVGVVNQTTDWGKDVTLVRNASATAPSTIYSLSDWTSYASDTTTYLGSHNLGRSITYVPGYQNRSVGNVTTYAVNGLNALTTYYYVVRSSNANGTSVNSNEKNVTTIAGTTPPSTPVATNATGINMNSFTATWNSVGGADNYRLDVSANSSFSSFVPGYNNLTVTGISQTVTGLNTSTTYYYRVRAYNSYGTSSNSNTISVTTLDNDPYNGYYASVAGLTGTDLKTGLHNLIDNNTYSNYDGAKLKLFQELDNDNGVVKCVYTGQEWTVNSSYNGSSNPNTEHTYAQSWFGSSEVSIKKADVHHLFITNSNVNSSRGNLPFDVVRSATATYTSDPAYISKRGTNAEGRTVFEPADPHKGNLARALLYFNVRYNMTLSQGGVDMLDQLIAWHYADPVDEEELTRNVKVHTHQGNRNPFVDHPEYVSSIWGGTPTTTIVQFNPASAQVNEGDGSVTLSVQILNPSSTATTAQVILSSGDATDVNNYTTTYLTFPANSSTNQTVTVYITDDSIMEGTETLVFSLQNVNGGNSAAVGNYSNFNLTIEDNDIPVPVATAATNISTTGFTANWNAVAGITDYEIDLSTSATFASYVSGYEAYSVTGDMHAITGLSGSTQYYYRVRSIFNQGISSNSNVINVNTLASTNPSATVVLRPAQIDISESTSESAILMNVQAYPSDDAKYRIYNGSYQYNVWKSETSEYITSSTYSNGPNVPGTPSVSSTWWIPFQRGNNVSVNGSYRDRLSPYNTNYQTIVLPASIAITNPVSILKEQIRFGTWNDYSSKYVVLGYDAISEGTLISATSTALESGNFNLKVETGTTINRIEIRDLNNNLIEAVTGAWPEALNPHIVIAGEPSFLMNIAGVPSEERSSYLIQGVDLIANIEVVAPEHFELSATGFAPWTSTLTLPPTFDGEIFVRIISSVVGEHSGLVTHNSTGATEVTIRVDGETLEPSSVIVTVANFTAFTHEVGVPSAAQSYTVSGIDITGSIYITAEAPFELSEDGVSGWANALELESTFNGLVYLRLNSSVTGIFTDKAITHNSANASPVQILVSGITSSSTGEMANLFFSEYIEGSSNNKAIEIYNATSSNVDLSNYKVELYSNGSSSIGNSITLSGLLAPGDVYVIANSNAVATILDAADVTSPVTNFNGNDALALRCLDPNSIIDVIGIIGDDPGTNTGWTVAGTANATYNHTLIRKPSVAQGNTNWITQAGTDSADSEWIVMPIDHTDNLGTHTANSSVEYTQIPVFDPAAGTYLSPVMVSLSCATPSALIRYTTDGTDPNTTTSNIYSSAFQIGSTTTVKAIAYAAGLEPSNIVSATYTLPTIISNIATLRTQTTGAANVYRLSGEAILTYQNASRNTKYIQDSSAAIVIDDVNATISTTYNLYDGLSGIIGYLNVYNELLQFVPLADPGVATSSGNVILPDVRSLSSLTSSDQGKLIKVLGTTISHATYTAFPATAQNLTATDASGSITLRTFPNTDYANIPISLTPINLVCLVGQFGTTMQVSPRFLSDFETEIEELETPVVTITLSNNNVELNWAVIANATSYKVWQSDDPVTGFEVLDANVTINQKTIPASAAKKFFYVTAHN